MQKYYFLFDVPNKLINFAHRIRQQAYYKYIVMIEISPELKPRWNDIIHDVLREYIKICKDNNLTYFCCGGTAIGAIRHQGMIPWDDDVDVFMPRPDYDRFIEIASRSLSADYELVTPYTYHDYPLYFAKLCNRRTTLMEESDTPCIYGLYIDIFPIEGAPDDVELARAMESKFRKTKNRLEAISTHNTFGEYIALIKQPKEWGRFVGKTFGFFFRSFYRKYLLGKMNSICYRYNYDDSKIVAVYCGSYGPKEVFPKSWLDGVVTFKYEGMKVNLPSGYDNYLRQYYGDYMQLPPEEKRISHHLKAYFNMDERLPDDEVLKIVGR